MLREYDAKAPVYRALARKIRASLAAICKKEKIHIHAIDCRVKDRDSLSLKLNRPDSFYGTLEEVTDIAGVRVITYYASDVDRVANIIQREYSIDTENSIDKGALLDPDRFGYLSLHYVVRLSERKSRSSSKQRFSGLRAEIQIRSILQHAWAEIEHDLGYKSRHAVPRKARRTFSRLSGLLELADQEFDDLLQSLQAYAREIAAARDAAIAIDRISLAHFIRSSGLVGQLDERIRSRVDLELVFEEWFVESLVDKLDFVGITEISSLESEMKRLSNRTETMATNHIKGRSYTRIHQGVSIYYFCSTLLADSSDVDRVQQYLERFGVGEPKRRQRIAQSIVKEYASAAQSHTSAEPSQ